MKWLFVFIFPLIIGSNLFQEKRDELVVEQAFVYEKKITHGSSFSIASDLSEIGTEVPKRALNRTQIAEINKLMSQLKLKKHHQKKIGCIERTFEFQTASGNYSFIIAFDRLINMTLFKEYKIDEKQKAFLLDL